MILKTELTSKIGMKLDFGGQFFLLSIVKELSERLNHEIDYSLEDNMFKIVLMLNSK